MKVFVILKEVWQEHTFEYYDGTVETKNWKKALVGDVRLSRKEAEDILLSDGWQIADIEWHNSDYVRHACIQEKFKWDDAYIIEREIPNG